MSETECKYFSGKFQKKYNNNSHNRNDIIGEHIDRKSVV